MCPFVQSLSQWPVGSEGRLVPGDVCVGSRWRSWMDAVAQQEKAIKLWSFLMQ